MNVLDLITGFGFFFGLDLLFWAWAIVTVVAFLNLIIPDPIPFVDEALLIGASIILLLMLAARGTVTFVSKAGTVLSQPAVVAFVVTITVLLIGGRFYRVWRNKK